MFYKDFRISVTGLVALVSLVFSCVVDDDYRISDIKDVNTEMTLFSGGLEVPVGSIGELRLDSVLKAFGGESLDSGEECSAARRRVHQGGEPCARASRRCDG